MKPDPLEAKALETVDEWEVDTVMRDGHRSTLERLILAALRAVEQPDTEGANMRSEEFKEVLAAAWANRQGDGLDCGVCDYGVPGPCTCAKPYPDTEGANMRSEEFEKVLAAAWEFLAVHGCSHVSCAPEIRLRAALSAFGPLEQAASRAVAEPIQKERS